MNYLLRSKKAILFLSVWVSAISFVQAQNIVKNGEVINTVTTAVPFLRIIPDARAGGMGDVGIAVPTYGNGDFLSPDVNGLYTNPSKLAFIDKDYGVAVTFSPWLKALVNDIYLANIAGYYKIKNKQTIAVSLRYFSLGNITFTDINGAETGQFRPNEFAIDAHYARQLSDNFSIAASLRFIYSNLAAGQQVSGALVRPGIAGAGDISWYYHKKFNANSAHKLEHEFSVGMNISNIGSKISYTNNVVRDYIPTNLGIGIGYTLDIDKHNSVGFYIDINKLMVPSPIPTAELMDSSGGIKEKYDKNSNSIPDWRERGISGMFTSFGDAPGGAREEFNEVTWGFGAEYLYNKQFGVRLGYFYENGFKGNRQFLTAGLTVKYSVVALNFSYLIPTTIQRNPLDNTLRFSLLFDFVKGGKKAGGTNNTGISLVPDEPKEKKGKNKEVKPEEVKPIEKEMKLEPVEPK